MNYVIRQIITISSIVIVSGAWGFSLGLWSAAAMSSQALANNTATALPSLAACVLALQLNSRTKT